MPSLLITLPSIFKIAALIVRAFGKTVKPILIAFERFVSSIVISFLTSAPFYITKTNLNKYHHSITKIFSRRKTRSKYKKHTDI
jgi:uncharacterized PurR-regulated membrane protein YhhQ (DUF165 family)